MSEQEKRDEYAAAQQGLRLPLERFMRASAELGIDAQAAWEVTGEEVQSATERVCGVAGKEVEA